MSNFIEGPLLADSRSTVLKTQGRLTGRLLTFKPCHQDEYVGRLNRFYPKNPHY